MLERLMISAGLIFTLSLVVPAPPAQTDPAWIGKRVVQKYRDFSLTVNGEPVERNRFVIDIYRVERTDELVALAQSGNTGLQRLGQAAGRGAAGPSPRLLHAQIEAKPVDPFFYTARALIWRQSSDFDKALRDYDQAIRLDPHDATAYRGRGFVWHSKRVYDKAIVDFDESIRLDPKSALTFIARGTTRTSKREFSNAIADYSEAIWLDPLAIEAYDRRGLAWHAKKEYLQGDHRLQRGHPARFSARFRLLQPRQGVGSTWPIRQGNRRSRSSDPER